MTKKELQKLVDNIPNKIRITKDVSYEVVWLDHFPDTDYQYGECRFDSKQIVINKNQSNTEKLSTTLHELLHAVAMENDIPLTEKQVMALERSLFRVLKLNGWIK